MGFFDLINSAFCLPLDCHLNFEHVIVHFSPIGCLQSHNNDGNMSLAPSSKRRRSSPLIYSYTQSDTRGTTNIYLLHASFWSKKCMWWYWLHKIVVNSYKAKSKWQKHHISHNDLCIVPLPVTISVYVLPGQAGFSDFNIFETEKESMLCYVKK